MDFKSRTQATKFTKRLQKSDLDYKSIDYKCRTWTTKVCSVRFLRLQKFVVSAFWDYKSLCGVHLFITKVCSVCLLRPQKFVVSAFSWVFGILLTAYNSKCCHCCIIDFASCPSCQAVLFWYMRSILSIISVNFLLIPSLYVDPSQWFLSTA